MRHPLLLLAACALTICSCNNGSHDVTPASFSYTGGYNIKIAESWDGKLTLDTRTNENLNCLNYKVGNTCLASGFNLAYTIEGISAPGTCKSGDGPAMDTATPGQLANGNYVLALKNDADQVMGSVKVEADKYTVTYPGGNNVTFNNLTVNRVPKASLWGTIKYADASFTAIADTFMDSLRFYGATDFSGAEVGYSTFTVFPGNTFTHEDDATITTPYRHFIFDFSGSDYQLKRLMNSYKKYGDDVKISMTTNYLFYGTKDTWQ